MCFVFSISILISISISIHLASSTTSIHSPTSLLFWFYYYYYISKLREIPISKLLSRLKYICTNCTNCQQHLMSAIICFAMILNANNHSAQTDIHIYCTIPVKQKQNRKIIEIFARIFHILKLQNSFNFVGVGVCVCVWNDIKNFGNHARFANYKVQPAHTGTHTNNIKTTMYAQWDKKKKQPQAQTTRYPPYKIVSMDFSATSECIQQRNEVILCVHSFDTYIPSIGIFNPKSIFDHLIPWKPAKKWSYNLIEQTKRFW